MVAYLRLFSRFLLTRTKIIKSSKRLVQVFYAPINLIHTLKDERISKPDLHFTIGLLTIITLLINGVAPISKVTYSVMQDLLLFVIIVGTLATTLNIFLDGSGALFFNKHVITTQIGKCLLIAILINLPILYSVFLVSIIGQFANIYSIKLYLLLASTLYSFVLLFLSIKIILEKSMKSSIVTILKFVVFLFLILIFISGMLNRVGL